MSIRKIMVSAATGLALLILAPSAYSSVNIMTGGDAGQGYAPLPVTTVAYNLISYNGPSQDAPVTMQGVSFLRWAVEYSANLTNESNGLASIDQPQYGYEWGAPTVDTGSSNDLALGQLVRSGAYLNAAGEMTMTVPNLTAGKSYQVDIITYNGLGDPNMYDGLYTVNGVTDTVTTVPNTFYDIRETVVPDGSNQIVINFGLNPSGTNFPYPRFDAISITTAGAPGDINNDGHVDLTDYGILTGHWLQAVAPGTNGDLNLDGVVSLADFKLFKADYNGGGGLGLAAPVPEPASFLLAGMASLGLCFAIARRRKERLPA